MRLRSQLAHTPWSSCASTLKECKRTSRRKANQDRRPCGFPEKLPKDGPPLWPIVKLGSGSKIQISTSIDRRIAKTSSVCIKTEIGKNDTFPQVIEPTNRTAGLAQGGQPVTGPAGAGVLSGSGDTGLGRGGRASLYGVRARSAEFISPLIGASPDKSPVEVRLGLRSPLWSRRCSPVPVGPGSCRLPSIQGFYHAEARGTRLPPKRTLH